jgi:hypothetical protein
MIEDLKILEQLYYGNHLEQNELIRANDLLTMLENEINRRC